MIKYLATFLLIGALGLMVPIVGCASSGGGGGGGTTQPVITIDYLVTLAIIDYDALIASGLVQETPELDAAISAVFAAKDAYAKGLGTIGAINAASMQLIIALGKARTK